MIILKKPIITEKSTKMASLGAYTFLVDSIASKLQIAKAIEDQFNVSVLKVKTLNVKGEVKVQRRVRKSYKTKGFKKAIVQIKKGQVIPIFETPKEEEEAMVTRAEEPQVIKEKKDILRRTKVKVERGATGAAPTTQRKVIPT